MAIEPEVVLSSLSLLLSLCLAAFYMRDRRHAKFAIESEYVNSLIAWHQQVVDVLMMSRCINRDRDSVEHREHLAKLSALIEQGRFFFPNISKGDGFGSHKPPAYRGYRNLALDFLVASYNLLHEPLTPAALDRLGILQRHFTSVVFELVRPSHRLETIRNLTDRYFVKEQSFEDFLDHPDGSSIEHIWQSRPKNE